jgi:hypothetical protein
MRQGFLLAGGFEVVAVAARLLRFSLSRAMTRVIARADRVRWITVRQSFDTYATTNTMGLVT